MAIVSRRKGQKIKHNGEEMKIISAQGFDSLYLQNALGEYFTVPIADIEAEAKNQKATKVNVDPIRESKVSTYADAFKPILKLDRHTKKDVEFVAQKLSISVASAYNALNRYKLSGLMSDLPPPTRPGGKGKSRLRPKAEEIIEQTIEDVLLNRRNYRPNVYYQKTEDRLKAAGLSVSRTTLTNRLANVPHYKWSKYRKGYTEAKRTLSGLMDANPPPDGPLDTIQIDHWFADIEIVSDDRLTPIGRPWVTLGIDIHSRMVYGMHVGLDAPSSTTLGLMMINGMTRKDATLKQYGIEIEYPMSGKPQQIVLDNAGEFTGNAMRSSCKHFGIDLKWRPVGSPNYGGHIERLNGNLANRFKELPGATGSTHMERKDFRPEVTAAFTLDDLTKQLWLMIDEYHNQIHTNIHMTPLEKFKCYYFGANGPKRPLPDVFIDDFDLRVNWYPLVTRSFQRYGIMIDHLQYYAESIEFLVRNRQNQKAVQIRRNPFDVREIYLLHPTQDEWITLPVRNLNFPIASIMELRAARKDTLKRKRDVTPKNLADCILARREHVDEVVKLTKMAQREQSKNAQHGRIRSSASALPLTQKSESEIEVAPFGKRGPTPIKKQTPQPTLSHSSQDISSILASISDEQIEASFNE